MLIINKITLKTLTQVVNKLIAIVIAHIGSNGNAHQIATNDTAGFMSTDDRYQIASKCRRATGLDPGQDIDALDFGIFVGRSFLNSPPAVDDSICLVEITGWNDSKKIEFTWLAKNITYVRYVSQSVDSGWPNNDFVDLTTMNGFTGKLIVRRNQTFSGFEIEVSFDLKCNLTNSTLVQFATLPSGYPSTSSKTITNYNAVRGQYSDGTNTTAGVLISGGNKLICYRQDGDFSKVLTTISGTIKFSR